MAETLVFSLSNTLLSLKNQLLQPSTKSLLDKTFKLNPVFCSDDTCTPSRFAFIPRLKDGEVFLSQSSPRGLYAPKIVNSAYWSNVMPAGLSFGCGSGSGGWELVIT